MMSLLRSDHPFTARAALLRALRLAGTACAVTLLVAASVAHAEDDDEALPERSFEQKLIDGLLTGLGGKNVENSKGIEYRERSPLVIPSKLDLPPPASTSAPAVANWPKDPDIQARKEAIAESRKPGVEWDDVKRPLRPSELAKRQSSKKRGGAMNDDRPGIDNSNYYMLSPSQLGFKNSMISNIFGAGKEETAKFTGEPERSELTQPPTGYQTPSSSYAYGAGPAESKTQTPYNPILDKGGN